MIFKKTLILLVAFLIVLFSLLNAVPVSQEIEDEKDVEQLLDKADYCYSKLEDYPRALTYLNRAVKLAVDPYIKADALIKTAYVYFLMKKDIKVYSSYIKEALKLDGSLELNRLLYKERFIAVFTTIKKEPRATSSEIETSLFQSETKKSGRNKFFVMLSTGYLFSLDSNYKKIYGNSSILPQIKVGFKISENFYMWTGYGGVKGKGLILEIGTNAESAQNFFALGFKYTRFFPKRLGYKLDVSTVKVSYSEKALDTKVKGSALGYNFEAGLVYNLGRCLFTEFYVGYLYASKLVLNKMITLGGFGAGLGLGMKF